MQPCKNHTTNEHYLVKYIMCMQPWKKNIAKESVTKLVYNVAQLHKGSKFYCEVFSYANHKPAHSS